MKLLVPLTFLVLAACGSTKPTKAELRPGYLTQQGLLVFDGTGKFPQADIELALKRIKELAPAKYDFALLDGYEIHIVPNRVVAECQQSNGTRALGCLVRERQQILLAYATCEDYRTTTSTLAHEIGHIFTGDSHDSDDWYAATGIADQIELAECGKIPLPGEHL